MSKRRILLVDDDEAVLEFLGAKLGDRYELVTTSVPEGVVGLARETRPDLILCDIEMPGTDGGDVSAQLYRDDETRHIPLLFLTGLVSGEELASQHGQLGGRQAISKSAPVGELIARIEALLA
jgi:CheY-like chemotaxis protein